MVTLSENHSQVLMGGIAILIVIACIYAKVHSVTKEAIWHREHTERVIRAKLVDTRHPEDIHNAIDTYAEKLDSLKRLDSLDHVAVRRYLVLPLAERSPEEENTFSEARKHGGPERDSLRSLYKERQKFCWDVLENDDTEYNLVRYVVHRADNTDEDGYVVICSHDNLDKAVLKAIHMPSNSVYRDGMRFWETVDIKSADR